MTQICLLSFIGLTLNLLHILYLIAALIPHSALMPADIKNVNRRFSPSLFTLGGRHMLYRLHPSRNSSVICIIYPRRVKARRYVCMLLARLSLTSSMWAQTPELPARPCLQQHPAFCTSRLEVTKLRVTYRHVGSQQTHPGGKARPPCFILFVRHSRLCSGLLQVFIKNDGKQIIWAVLFIRRHQRSIAPQ